MLTGDEEQLSPLQETEAPAVDSAMWPAAFGPCDSVRGAVDQTTHLVSFQERCPGASPVHKLLEEAGKRQTGCGLFAVTDELSLEVSQSVFPGHLITASREGITWGYWLICRNAWVPT